MGRFRGSHRGPRAGGIKQAHGAPRSRGDELSTGTIHSGHVFPLLAIGGPRRHIGVSNLTEGSTLTKPGFGGAWSPVLRLAGEANELLAPMRSVSRLTADVYRREQASPLLLSLIRDFHVPNILRAPRYYGCIRHREQSEAIQTRVLYCGLVTIASLCSQ